MWTVRVRYSMPREGKKSLTVGEETFERLKDRKEAFEGTWDDFFDEYVESRGAESKGERHLSFVSCSDGDEVYRHPKKREFMVVPEEEIPDRAE